jgi:transcriptional regulator with XRE-family HTH domain
VTSQLPDLLRRHRRELRLSLKDVARRLGVHFTTVSSWERGRSEPGFQVLQELADLYGVPLVDLLGSGRQSPPERPFRALSPAAGELILKTLEELRLAASLEAELAREGAPDELARRTGIPTGRLGALGSGQAAFRPAEVAAVVREIGSAGQASLPEEGAPGEPAPDQGPGDLHHRLGRFLDRLRRYVEGEGGRAHQKETKGSSSS